MTDKPIIFSGPMVRALIDGRKTQTRRKIKPTRKITSLGYTDPLLRLDALDGMLWWWDGVHERVGASQAYPYAPGDRLWVREAFQTGIWRGQDVQATYRATKDLPWEGPWRPSIHMPRWASRLTLTVTDVRVQLLQEISEADARAEGVKAGDWPDRPECDCDDDDCVACSHYPALYKPAFRHLWNSLHGPDAWGANPWVCALTFTVERRNIDA